MKNIMIMLAMVLIGTTSCNSLKQKQVNPHIQLTKKRCLGTCPVYDLFIYRDGLVSYHGIDNVVKKGKYKFKISPDELVEIETLFVKSKFALANEQKGSKVRDLPITQLRFDNKTVSYTGQNIPEKIKDLITTLEQLVTKK